MMTARVPAPMYTRSPSGSSTGNYCIWIPGRYRTETTHCRAHTIATTLPRVVDERERRIGENEAYWRQVNELSPPEPGVMNRMFCECGRLDCQEHVAMTADEYNAVRSKPTTFLVVPGHALTDVETVVETTERFEVVEKKGEAARVAIETEPA